MARRHHLIFLVDAAQTAGKYPIDVADSNIDLLAFSGHKGLFGPPGTGVLFIGSRVNLDSVREGGTGSFSEQEEQPEILPDKYESGTLNSVGIAGLGAGLKFIFDQSLDKIIAHEKFLADKLIAGLRGIPGVILYLPKDLSRMVPVVAFNIKGYQPGEVGTILDQAFDIKVRAGLQCAPVAHKTLGTFPSGTVRLSPGYLNLAEEIELTVNAVEKIAVHVIRQDNPVTFLFARQQKGDLNLTKIIERTANDIGLVETQYFTFGNPPDELVLESGEKLGPVTLAYETYGTLNQDKSNAILILHALTGNAHVAGFHPDEKDPGWWDNMIGHGKAFDIDKYFVICSNVIGGCQGSTGPSSINPKTGKPYGLDFPLITIKDMVNAQAHLVRSLGH